MSTLVFVDPRVPPKLTDLRAPVCQYPCWRPYECQLVDFTYTPPVGHVKESEGFDTSGAGSMSSDSTTPVSPDHPLTHDTLVLVPSLCRTTRMAVRVQPTMSPGCSARITEVAAMSDVAFCKRFRSPYGEFHHPLTLPPVSGGYRGRRGRGSDAKDEDSRRGMRFQFRYSTFEVGQSFGSAPETERLERVSTFRQPTLTTWTDPEDGHIDTRMASMSRAGYDDHRLVHDLLVQRAALQRELQEMSIKPSSVGMEFPVNDVVFATVNWKGKQILIANVHVILVLDSDVMKVLFSATVMAISVISISSDSSEDSVGTPARRWIPTETPIIAPTIPLSPDYTPASPDTHIASDSESPIIPRRRVMILSPGQPIHLQFDRYATIANGPIQLLMRGVVWTVSCFRKLAVGHLCLIILHQIYFSSDDPARDSSSDSSFEASSDFHSDASSDSSSGHSLSDHSSPDLLSTSAGPSRKRRRSPTMSVPALSPVFGALSPVPHLEQDIDPEIQAEIDECFAYADALRDREIDARVVVEAVDRDETETNVRGPVEVRVERVTHPAMPKDIPEPAQEGAVEVTYGTLGDFVQRIVRVESAVTALTERVAELERDNMMLRGTGRQTCACARSYQWIPSLEDSLKMLNTRSGASMTHEEVEELVNDEVALKQMEEIEMEEMEEMEMEETEKTEMDTGMETMA
ncbi:hypothetical protein Tco_1504388 [Tanacetum coccineum]